MNKDVNESTYRTNLLLHTCPLFMLASKVIYNWHADISEVKEAGDMHHR